MEILLPISQVEKKRIRQISTKDGIELISPIKNSKPKLTILKHITIYVPAYTTMLSV
jgi:hypothetical protein